MKYLLITIAFCGFGLLVYGCSSKRPSDIGLNNGRLATCPNSPNCVSSQADDESHAIPPIAMNGESALVMNRLTQIISTMPGSKIVKNENNYLHAEFTSRFWRFVDDLECYYDLRGGKIEVRSASRIGYSDFNVNRQRVEKLRTLLTNKK
jgi:uncharacterized protein (DUF1499 family)